MKLHLNKFRHLLSRIKLTPWLLASFLFLIPVLGFNFGGGTAFEVRNYQYAVAVFFLWFIWKRDLFLSPKRHEIYLLLGTSFFAYLADTQSIYWGFGLNAEDFSIFEGMLQQALRGNWGFQKLTEINHFAVHQNWILLLALPLYFILPHPLLLMILPMLALWITGIVVAKIALALGKDSAFAWISAICWWTAAFTCQMLHRGFYPESFFPLFLTLFILAQIRKQEFMTILWGLLFLMVKEDAAIYLAGFCFWGVIQKDRASILVLLASAFFIFINFGLIKPLFPSLHSSGLQWWDHWGNSPSQIILESLKNPLRSFTEILNSLGWKLLYGPLLLIPLFNLKVALASLPFVGLFGIAQGAPAEYGAYYAIVLWPLALYGMIESGFPRKLVLSLLVIYPLTNASWIGTREFDFKNWNSMQALKSKLTPQSKFCLQNGLLPYFSYLDQGHLFPMRNLQTQQCHPVVSFFVSSHPHSRQELDSFYQLGKTNNCLAQEIDHIVIFKSDDHCRALLQRDQ